MCMQRSTPEKLIIVPVLGIRRTLRPTLINNGIFNPLADCRATVNLDFYFSFNFVAINNRKVIYSKCFLPMQSPFFTFFSTTSPRR